MNPFEDDIVRNPRKVQINVTGVNEQAYQQILDSFYKLEAGKIPRFIPCDKAQLVISRSAGYGKSHLIYRLFQTLDDRATLVNILPLTNPDRAWESVLQHTIDELMQPDSFDEKKWPDPHLSQLDVFARSVITHLLIDLIERGQITTENVEELKKDLSKHQNDSPAGEGYSAWVHWVPRWFPQCAEILETGLENIMREKVPGTAPLAHGWLKVLVRFISSKASSPERRICLAWLRGQPLEDEDIRSLSIEKKHYPFIEDSSGINDLCKSRIRDLCLLAGYYRPFLFCFDQTEYYKDSFERARAFSQIIDSFVMFTLYNHLLVVTGNEAPWTAIQINMENAMKDRFSFPIILEGIHQKQAEELINLRLKAYVVNTEMPHSFNRVAVFNKNFPHQNSTVPVRLLLQECSQAWNKANINPLPASQTPEQKLTAKMDEFFNENMNRSDFRRFDDDYLRWFITAIYNGNSNPISRENHPKNYYEYIWKNEKTCLLFGFVRSDHWRTWNAISGHTEDRLTKTNLINVAAIYLRTPELDHIPKASWDVAKTTIVKAQQKHLRIVKLTTEEIAEIYALRDLHGELLQGNIQDCAEQDFWSSSKVKTLLVKWEAYFRAFAEKPAIIIDPPSPPPQYPPQINPSDILEVVEMMRIHKMSSVEALQGRLKKKISESVIMEAASRAPQIKVSKSGSQTVLLWLESI